LALGSASAAELRDPDPEPVPSPPVTSEQRALAAGAAVVPGLVLHGSGNFVLGRKQTAFTLLKLEGIGLGLLGLGGVLLFSTGAARDFAATGATLAMAGSGLFTTSFLADFYSVLAPPGGTGRDPGWVPVLETELGYRYVYDPTFDYRNFLVTSLTARYDRLRLTPSLWASPDTANQRARIELAGRVMGPTPDRPRVGGSYFDVELAFTEHRYGFEGFSHTTTEGSVLGRWDLGESDVNLAGAFIDYGLGVGAQIYQYDFAPDDDTSSTLLLGGFGFGLYLGDRSPVGGEVRVYYDHRHDGYAAGMLMNGLGSGAIGHFGFDGLYYFSEHWGGLVEAQVGSALVVGASGLFRFGGEP
jgi:hypothetical protein